MTWFPMQMLPSQDAQAAKTLAKVVDNHNNHKVVLTGRRLGWPERWQRVQIGKGGQPKWPERSARGTSEAPKPAEMLAPGSDPNGRLAEMARTQGKGDE